MHRVCLIDMPGLSRELLQYVPATSALGQWLAKQQIATLVPPWPALTCPVQATLTTGRSPSEHGIIANGLATFRSPEDQSLIDASNFASYRRQVSFWEQSNQLIQARRFWQDDNGYSRYRTALLFFQNSMPGFSGTLKPAADVVITPKPEHGPDGKITSLLWTEPRDLVPRLFEQFGPFPLLNYWGPMAGIASSRRIARAAAWIWQNQRPQLQLTYVPHLDYDLQRFGPDSPEAMQAVADVSAALEPLIESVLGDGAKLLLLSEYSMQRVDRCMQPNRLLAENGLLVMHQTDDGPLIDYERSDAFALVDHQVAHVFVRSRKAIPRVRDVLLASGLREVSPEHRVNHPRAGDLQVEAEPEAWIDYRWWQSDEDAPVFARKVDIHRKPGYDPLELFLDPATKGISQDTSLVRGSHGRANTSDGLVAAAPADALPTSLPASEISRLVQGLIQ